MNKFIKEMMEIGMWEDRAGSETERNNAIKAAEELYEKHLAELNLLTTPVIIVPKGTLCDVCGSDDIIEAPSVGRNCNNCNPI